MFWVLQVLSNHMVSGVYSYDDLLEGASDAGFLGLVLQTVNGEDLKLTTDGFNLWVVPEGSDPSIAPASILRRDVETCAGIMHVVDSLLAPPGMKIAGSSFQYKTISVVAAKLFHVSIWQVFVLYTVRAWQLCIECMHVVHLYNLVFFYFVSGLCRVTIINSQPSGHPP